MYGIFRRRTTGELYAIQTKNGQILRAAGPMTQREAESDDWRETVVGYLNNADSTESLADGKWLEECGGLVVARE